MLFTLLASTALAAPTFQAANPQVQATAQLAWEAAALCTGWEAAAHPVVEIVEQPIEHGLIGMAEHDEQGLSRILLNAEPERRPEVLIHEIAHAWVKKGPTTLVEGRTQLLADCIALERPGIAPLQWDDGRALTSLSNLRTWNQSTDHGFRTAGETTDSYLAASRLVRTAALILPAQALWPPDDTLGWTEFEKLLSDVGPIAKPFIDLVNASVDVQQQGLSDADKDGLPRIGERLFNTDPERWDTDKDGWWDGAAVPARVTPLPFDGSPVCSGWRTGDTPSKVQLQIGGNLRGSPAPVPRLYVGNKPVESQQITVPAKTSVLITLKHGAEIVSGGLWAQVKGDTLQPDQQCIDDRRYTAWSNADAFAPLLPHFIDELTKSMNRADTKFGTNPLRIAVQLGGEVTIHRDGVIHLADHDIRLALRRDELRNLATQAVAIHRLATQQAFIRDWTEVQALARAIDSDDG